MDGGGQDNGPGVDYVLHHQNILDVLFKGSVAFRSQIALCRGSYCKLSRCRSQSAEELPLTRLSCLWQFKNAKHGSVLASFQAVFCPILSIQLLKAFLQIAGMTILQLL